MSSEFGSAKSASSVSESMSCDAGVEITLAIVERPFMMPAIGATFSACSACCDAGMPVSVQIDLLSGPAWMIDHLWWSTNCAEPIGMQVAEATGFGECVFQFTVGFCGHIVVLTRSIVVPAP